MEQLFRATIVIKRFKKRLKTKKEINVTKISNKESKRKSDDLAAAQSRIKFAPYYNMFSSRMIQKLVTEKPSK